MAGPKELQNPLRAYRGDPYSLEIPFSDENGDPIDVSASNFLLTSNNDGDDFSFDVNPGSASNKILVTLTPVQTTDAPQTIIADLIETPIWDKTILRWTHVFDERAKAGVVVP